METRNRRKERPTMDAEKNGAGTTPDPADIEPTDAEVAAAAEQEAREASQRTKAAAKKTTAKKTTPPTSSEKRGPGRPPGAKNKTPAASAAASKGSSTRSTTTTPKALPPGGSASTDADREARRKIREARTARVNELVGQAKEQRPGFVMGVGTLTGLPVQYLVQPRTDNGQVVLDHDTQQPIPELTVYGAQLAPKDWQIRTAVEAYVRVEETEMGEKLTEVFDKWAPYVLAVGAVGAVGIYAFTTLQISTALKPMIAEEIRRAAEQQAQQGQPAPDAAGT